MNSASRPTRLQWILFALIIAVAAFVRFIYIGSTEAQFDELWHLEISTGRGSLHGFLPQDQLFEAPAVTSLRDAPPWYSVWNHLDTVTHPPVYPMTLRLWRGLFGESISAARAWSAVASILCVALLFEAVRRQFGAGIGLWAALILALSSAQVDQAQEIRNYPLATAFCLVAACALISIEATGEASTRRLVTLSIGVFAALLTHYFVLPVIAALVIYTFSRLRQPVRRKALLAVAGGCLLFAIVWSPWLWRQLPYFGNAATDPAALLESREGSFSRTMGRAAVIPLRMLFEPRTRAQFVAPLGAVLFVIPWLLIKRRPGLLLWTIWLSCVVGFIAAIDLARASRHLELLRHTILAGPAVCVILAAATSAARPILANGIPCAIAVACAIALPSTYTRQYPDYSSIGRALADHATAREPVIFYSDAHAPFWAEWMYVGAAHYSDTFPRPSAIIHSPPGAELMSRLRKFDHFWIVYGATALESDQIIPGTRRMPGTVSGSPFVGHVARLEWTDRIPSPP